MGDVSETSNIFLKLRAVLFLSFRALGGPLIAEILFAKKFWRG